MTERPLFSVIMPNYNNGKYISEAIESVLSQKYPRWELVIVDDASTDNSLEVIKRYQSDRRIKIITSKVNRGVSHAARLAVDNSSGEIFGILDSDDALIDDALVVMIDAHEARPDYGLIFSNHYQCDHALKIVDRAPWIGEKPDNMCLQEFLIDKLFTAVTISTHFRTFKRTAYDKTEGYDISLLCYEDRDLYYKLEKVTRIKGINRCLYYYRNADEIGAYRQNPKEKYYWFKCEYKETKRRLGVKLPFADKNNISPFLSNIMYMFLIRHSKINRKKLRTKLHYFLLNVGYDNLKKNKLLAFLYFINSYSYGYAPITFTRIKNFIVPNLSEK